MADRIGLGFQGELMYRTETVYGTEDVSQTSYFVSDKVMNVKLDTGDMFKTLRGISSASVCAFISQPSDPALHIEWVLQPNANSSLAKHIIERRNDGSLQPLTFHYYTNSKGNGTHYTLEGCIGKNFNVSAGRGEEIICNADFDVCSVGTAATTAAPNKPSAIGTKFAQFTKAGVGVTFAGDNHTFHITDSFEINLENNTEAYWNCDSASKATVCAGAIDVTGSCDVSLDNGGGVHWGDVFGGKGIDTLTIATGCTGLDDTFVLSTGRFTDTSIELNATDAGMITSQPFTFEELRIS